jgi:hypothetical protein
MRFWLGVFVGALLMALYAYRKEIGDIIHNRKAISAGAKTAEGVSKTVEGLKELFGEVGQ